MTTTTFTDLITDESQLRDVFGWPSERSLNKQIDRLGQHCRAIIAKSPFLLLGTSDTTGRCDVSPKGDYPGFVRVLDDKTIAIPDLPGNNRLDTLTNMLNNPQVGLLFMIPGMGHCQGGPGPNQVNYMAALERWRESGVAPDHLEAFHVTNNRVDMARPLCPYPQVAQYKGTGSTNDAANFVCKAAQSSAN